MAGLGVSRLGRVDIYLEEVHLDMLLAEEMWALTVTIGAMVDVAEEVTCEMKVGKTISSLLSPQLFAWLLRAYVLKALASLTLGVVSQPNLLQRLNYCCPGLSD